MFLRTSGTPKFSIWIINIITTATTFIYKNTVRINESSFLLMFFAAGLILHSSLFTEKYLNALQLKNLIAVKKNFYINVSILFILYHVFSLNSCEFLIYHQL